MRNVSGKSCRKNENIFIFNNFFSENYVVYGIMWKNTVEPDRPCMPTLYDAYRMRFACPITKARILTPSVILNTYYFSIATVVT